MTRSNASSNTFGSHTSILRSSVLTIGVPPPVKQRDRLHTRRFVESAETLKDRRAHALAFADDAEEQVLGPDVVVAQPLGFVLRQHEHLT